MSAASNEQRNLNPLRPYVWGTAAIALALPWVAMQFTEEVNWTAGDFVIFGAMLLAACLAWEIATTLSASRLYRTGVGLAVAATFLLTWINLAVGIVGPPEHPVNAWLFAAPAAGLAVATLGRFNARAMAGAALVAAVVQAITAIVALAQGLDAPATPLIGLTLLFTMMWLVSAALFHRAAHS
ncbi:MAG: hypothetical protein R3348_07940 [Xanthomonadales bacterium]|nr:hypothetical protein [Xanthomonadales bacterium]